MKLLLRSFVAALLCLTLASPTLAELVSFSSETGQARFASAKAKVDFAILANRFEPQTNNVFCGPTSAAIVLNAIQQANPPYTQENVITGIPKTRAQVFGEPIDGKADYGYQIRQLNNLFQQHGQTTKLVIVDNELPSDVIRKDMVNNLKRLGDYLVVNYQRKAVGQKGGGHISPVAAYDDQSDSFLVLDVNPNNQPWTWISAETLIQAMRTFDTLENRGYIHVGKTQ